MRTDRAQVAKTTVAVCASGNNYLGRCLLQFGRNLLDVEGTMDIKRKGSPSDADEEQRIAERLLIALRKAGYSADYAENILAGRESSPSRRAN